MFTIVFLSFHSETHIKRLVSGIKKKYTIIIIENSLNVKLKNELEEISDNGFDTLLEIDEMYPKIIHLYLEDMVSLETVCIVNRLTGFIEKANSFISETILWPDLYKKILNY